MSAWFPSPATRVLHLEISSSRINVLEVHATGPRPHVTNAAIIDYLLDSDDLAHAQLRETFDTKGITSKRAVISMTGPDIGITTIQLPPVSLNERDIIVQRKAQEAIGSPFADYEYDYRVLGRVEKAGMSQDQILLAYAPRKTLVAAHEFIQRCGLELERITPLPLTLVALVRASHPLGEIGIVNLVSTGAHLVIVKDGHFRFHREIRTAVQASDDAAQTLEFLGTEIRSSLLYFHQQFRGERVEKFLVCGEGDLKATCTTITTATQLVATPYDVTRVVDLPVPDGEQGEFQRMAPAMTIPLGLAVGSADDINLLPTFVRKRSGAWGLAVAAAIGIVLLSGLLWGHHEVSADITQINTAILAKEQEEERLQTPVEAARATQQHRAHDLARALFLEHAPRHAMFFPHLLQEISRLVPTSIILQSIDITRTQTSQRLDMNGEVVGSTLTSALEILDAFYQDVYRSPFLVESTMTMNHQPNMDSEEQNRSNAVSFHISADLPIQDLVVVRTGP